MKFINLILISLILMIMPLSTSDTSNVSISNINKKNFSNIKLSYLDIKITTDNKPLFQLEIPKIKIKRNVYNYNSFLNNVDKNVTLLYPKKFDINSTIVLAAHSGDASIAFFNNIDLLSEDDVISLYFDNSNYLYKVTDKFEVTKNHLLQIAKENDAIYLTTCSKIDSNKQLVIKAKKQ